MANLTLPKNVAQRQIDHNKRHATPAAVQRYLSAQSSILPGGGSPEQLVYMRPNSAAMQRNEEGAYMVRLAGQRGTRAASARLCGKDNDTICVAVYAGVRYVRRQHQGAHPRHKADCYFLNQCRSLRHLHAIPSDVHYSSSRGLRHRRKPSPRMSSPQQSWSREGR